MNLRLGTTSLTASVLALTIGVIVLAGCGGGPQTVGPKDGGKASSEASGAPKTMEQRGISITKEGFSPAKLQVKRGTRVVWSNDDDVKRSITIGKGGVSSGDIEPGRVAMHVFPDAGTFTYYDSSDSSVSGVVVVK